MGRRERCAQERTDRCEAACSSRAAQRGRGRLHGAGVGEQVAQRGQRRVHVNGGEVLRCKQLLRAQLGQDLPLNVRREEDLHDLRGEVSEGGAMQTLTRN